MRALTLFGTPPLKTLIYVKMKFRFRSQNFSLESFVFLSLTLPSLDENATPSFYLTRCLT
jgi:hypothetical protein